MNQVDSTSKSTKEPIRHQSKPLNDRKQADDSDFDECIEGLLASSKVYRNTGKIINKFLSKRDRVKSLLNMFEEILKEELEYISSLLLKFNKNFTFERFKEEIVNNLYIYKENLKLTMNILLDEKFENINNQIQTEKYRLADLFKKRVSCSGLPGLKSSLMECIKEENEEVVENYSCQERSSTTNLEALDTIKRSHIDINEYLSDTEKTINIKESSSPRDEINKLKDSGYLIKDNRKLNGSSDKLICKDISVSRSKKTKTTKNIIMSVQYFTNSVKQRFKMTPKLKKKDGGPPSIKFLDKH